MSAAPELRGPRLVRHTIASRLETRLPLHLAACRTAWGLAVEDLPDPVLYLPRQPTSVADRWPTLAVTNGRRSHRKVGMGDNGQPEFTSSTSCRVFTWVKARGHDAAQDQRDNMATAVEIALLADQSLGTNGDIWIDESSIVIEFSDVEAVKGDRYLAGSYVEVDVRATETLTDRLARPGQPAGATVERVSVNGPAYGASHPALLD